MKKEQLYDNRTGEAIVPIGHTEATYDANGNTVEQRLTHETQDREAADIDLQRDVAELQDTTARVGDGYEPDLSVTDASGNSIVQFQNGHIKTKNFNSAEVQEDLEQVQSRMTELDEVEDDVAGLKETSPKISNGESMIDLSITDENGMNIVEFHDGHVRTKYFDSANSPNTSGSHSDFSITDGNGRIIADFVNGGIRTKNFDSSKEKTIRILAIGNSYSYDGFSYVPKLLEEIAEVNVVFGILYRAGCSLQEHWEEFFGTDSPYYNDTVSYANYGLYETSRGSWALNVIYPIPSDVIASQPWDVVIIQQAHTVSMDANSYQPYLNNIINRILEYLKSPVRFGFFLTPPLPQGRNDRTEQDADNDYSATATNVRNLLDSTLIDFVLPGGTAVQNARHCALDSIPTIGGVVGHLNWVRDGVIDVHLNEGLPCLCEAYACTLQLLDMMGKRYTGVFGSQVRPTDDWIMRLNPINRQGVSAGVTDANCRLAQKCAEWAYKKPFEITENIT